MLREGTLDDVAGAAAVRQRAWPESIVTHARPSFAPGRELVDAARKTNRAVSIGLVGNCADVIPEMVKRNFVPDLLTDQTSAHDPQVGYIPRGLSLHEAAELRRDDPQKYLSRVKESVNAHVTAMLVGASHPARKAAGPGPALARNVPVEVCE